MAQVFEEHYLVGTLGGPIKTMDTNFNGSFGNSAIYVQSPIDDDFAARFDGTGGYGINEQNLASPVTVRTFSRYVQFDDGTATSTNTAIMLIDTGSGSTRAQLTFRSDRRLAIRNVLTSVNQTSHVVEAGRLYRIVWKINGTSQSLDLYDGVTNSLIETISGPCDGSGFDRIREGWVSNPNGDVSMIMDRCIDDDTIVDIPPYMAAGPVVLSESFESGVDGQDIVSGQTLFSEYFGQASKFSASPTIDGNLAMRSTVVYDQSSINRISMPIQDQVWASFYMYLHTAPDRNTAFASWVGDGVEVGDFGLTADMRLRIRDINVSQWLSDPIAVGEWHRIAIYIDPGSSTGHRLKVYSGANLHGTTASQDSGGQAATASGASSIDTFRLGITISATVDVSFDRLMIDGAAEPAPYEPEAGGPVGEIALLGQTVADTWGSSITVNYSSVVGSTLVLLVGGHDGSVDTVSDSAGNTWIKAANTADVPNIDGQRWGQLYYCIDAAAITSVTVSRSITARYTAALTEWTGVGGFREALVARKGNGEIPIAAESGDLILSASFVYESPMYITPAPVGYTDLTPAIRESYITNSGYKIAETSGVHDAVWGSKANSGLINAVFIPAEEEEGPVGPEVLFSWNGDNGQVLPTVNTGGVTIEDDGLRPPVMRMDSTGETRSIAQWEVDTQSQATVRAYFKTPSAWTGNSVTLIQFASDWTGHVRFALGGSGQPGQVRITSLGGTSQYSSNNVVENDTWYRVEFMIDQANSRARFYLYEGDSEVLHHGTGWVSADFGSSFDRVRIGIDNNTGSSPYLFDDIKAIDELRLLGPARPAPLYEYGYEEGTDAQAITTASPGVISTVGSPVYTNSGVAHGNMAALLPATSPAPGLYYAAPNNSAFTLSFYVRLNTKGSGAAYALRLADGTNIMAAFRFHPDGKFDLSNSSQISVVSSNISYEVDKWYRVDTQVSLDASTLHVKSAIYEPHESVYPVDTIESSFAGVSDITRFSLATAQASWSLTFDTLRVYDGLIEPGPYGPPVNPVGSVLHSWVGAPTQTAFQVVTKLSGTMSARLAVSLDEDMAAPTYTEAIEPSAEGYVRFDATGLSPGQQYYYQVECNGVPTGPIGRARTLRQQATPQNFSVAVGSCVLKNKNDGVAIDDLRLWNPDLFIHLGDFYYTSSTSDDPATFEALYADLIQTYPGLSQLMGEIPSYYTVSDHEAGVDNGDSNNIWTEAHIEAYRQVAPHRMVDTSPSPRGRWQSWVIGRVRFIMLDIRHLDRTPGAEADSASKTMLGTIQKAWLKSELLQPELLKVIISDVGWMGPPSLTNGTDKWWAYSTERQEIIDFIQTNNINVDLWHGDSHSIAVAGKSTNSYGGFPVICASPLAQTGGGRNLNEFDSYYNNSGGEARQYMRITFTDDGTTITRTASGWDAAAGLERVSSVETWSGGSGPNVTVWDGTQRLPATVRGVWDGTQIVPGKIKNIGQ